MNQDYQLQVEIVWSPNVSQPGFKGSAEAVSGENDVGKFDILPLHANFVSLIFNSLTVQTPEKKKLDYKFKRGVLEVSENKVNVFLGI
jgi:F0F1-type ATP synthase epsilon subunit